MLRQALTKRPSEKAFGISVCFLVPPPPPPFYLQQKVSWGHKSSLLPLGGFEKELLRPFAIRPPSLPAAAGTGADLMLSLRLEALGMLGMLELLPKELKVRVSYL